MVWSKLVSLTPFPRDSLGRALFFSPLLGPFNLFRKVLEHCLWVLVFR